MCIRDRLLTPSAIALRTAGLFWLSALLLLGLVACDPAPPPATSIELAPSYQDPALLDLSLIHI